MTGDVGRVDDEGFFYVLDRKKELIKYNAVQGMSHRQLK
jgi:long-subunit acyl-CoA synthetase (AMP-forming)